MIGGEDYSMVAMDFTFNPDVPVRPLCKSVSIHNDNIAEVRSEYFIINLSTREDGVILNPGQSRNLIVDDDGTYNK